MCLNQIDPNVVDAVEGVLATMVKDCEEFTAHDVTRRARAVVGHGLMIMHKDAREVVHEFMANRNDYYKEQDFNLHPYGPFVYKPIDGGPVSVATRHDYVDTSDNRGRTCIPKSMTDAIRVSPGTTVCAYRAGKTLVLDKDCTKSDDHYNVDRDGNVRLRLSKWGMSCPVHIEQNGSVLEISETF